jgi:hypothetical protein
MRRLLILFLVSIGSIIFFPSLAGCAKGGGDSPTRRRDGGSANMLDSVDASHLPDFVADASRRSDAAVSIDAAHRIDAVTPRVPMRESCNGEDDDLDSRIDEDFRCPQGRMGEICITSCGANGYRLCEAPSCSWSTTCHTFDEVCGDTLDNDCNGVVDDGCDGNPGTGWVCDDAMTRIHLAPDPARLGPCAVGWTLILWGSGGTYEMYTSAPGAPLDVTIRDDWLGWAAFTAYCGDWDHVRRWEAFEGRDSASAGVSVTIDGDDVPVQVCYDPGGGLIRPLVPVQCGLPACPVSY